ncbi:MAG: LacI family DNA-binding transcriptional regulator [Fimbriimonas sp.]
MAITLKDVARLAGTSSAAVSATLNGTLGKSTRVGPETRKRILAAGAELGYVSNAIAKSLATGRTGVIGFMLPYSSSFVEHDPFLTNVMNGILAEAVRQRYNVMLYTATSEEEGACAATMVDSRVDGVILVIPPPDSPIFANCAQREIPVVSVLRHATSPDECVVNSNDYEGGRLATQHLIDLGHRRIAHISGNEAVTTTAARRQGYLDALKDAGIEPDPRLLVHGGFSREGGAAATQQLLTLRSGRPTALFCANDLCAHGAMQYAQGKGVRVPEHLAVVGYDDTWYSTMTQPPLTTVSMAVETMGVQAARLLIAKVEGRPTTDHQPVLPVSLTIRESCGAARHLSRSTEKLS